MRASWWGKSGDLHAGISTCDYEYFALEVGESVGMESHVQNEYCTWVNVWRCNTKKQIIQFLGLSSMFMMRKDAPKFRCCYYIYTTLVEQYRRYLLLNLGCYSEHQISWASCMTLDTLKRWTNRGERVSQLHEAWGAVRTPVWNRRGSDSSLWAGCINRLSLPSSITNFIITLDSIMISMCQPANSTVPPVQLVLMPQLSEVRTRPLSIIKTTWLAHHVRP